MKPTHTLVYLKFIKVLLAVVLLTGSKDDVVAVTFRSSYVGNIL